MDPAHTAQYNWSLIVGVCLKYRLDIAGDILEGPLFHIFHDAQREGILKGYFRCKRKWYLVKKWRSSPQTVTYLKGCRSYIKQKAGKKYIRIVRNIEVEYLAELETV